MRLPKHKPTDFNDWWVFHWNFKGFRVFGFSSILPDFPRFSPIISYFPPKYETKYETKNAPSRSPAEG